VWPRTLKGKRTVLYTIIVLNTFLIFLDLFVLSDNAAALVSFLTCVVSWMGILALDRLEKLEAQREISIKRHLDDSDNSENNEKE
jgi:hypothetical protein